ncbi:hypothetical protein [Eisenbergiella sp.]
MMNFYKRELKKLIDYNAVLTDVHYIGSACYGKLSSDIRVKINFAGTKVADHYDALKITLLNRTEGQIDNINLYFQDIWGMKKTNNPNFREGISPHIWNNGVQAEWYGYQPKSSDYQELIKAVNSYLELFQEPMQEQTGQKMQ